MYYYSELDSKLSWKSGQYIEVFSTNRRKGMFIYHLLNCNHVSSYNYMNVTSTLHFDEMPTGKEGGGVDMCTFTVQ